jgi:hypothetical protein
MTNQSIQRKIAPTHPVPLTGQRTIAPVQGDTQRDQQQEAAQDRPAAARPTGHPVPPRQAVPTHPVTIYIQNSIVTMHTYFAGGSWHYRVSPAQPLFGWYPVPPPPQEPVARGARTVRLLAGFIGGLIGSGIVIGGLLLIG